MRKHSCAVAGEMCKFVFRSPSCNGFNGLGFSCNGFKRSFSLHRSSVKPVQMGGFAHPVHLLSVRTSE